MKSLSLHYFVNFPKINLGCKKQVTFNTIVTLTSIFLSTLFFSTLYANDNFTSKLQTKSYDVNGHRYSDFESAKHESCAAPNSYWTVESCYQKRTERSNDYNRIYMEYVLKLVKDGTTVVSPTATINEELGCPINYPSKVDFNGDTKTDICVKPKTCTGETVEDLLFNPISCRTGEKVEENLIYSSYGADPLSYSTYYSSPKYQPDADDIGSPYLYHIGAQRNDNHYRSFVKIYESDGGSVYEVTYKNGANYIFYTPNGGKSNGARFSSNYVNAGTLIPASDGTFTQTLASGIAYKYNASGLLDELKKPDGNTHTYTYTSSGKIKTVTNQYNKQLQYFYNEDEQLIELVNPEGKSYHFEYDSNGNLTKLIYPDETPSTLVDNPSITYLFENPNFPNHLTGKINEKGIRFATWKYDEKGRAISSEHANGLEKGLLDFSIANQTRVTTFITDTISNDAIYHYITATVRGVPVKQLAKIEQLACTDCEVGDWLYEYDNNGYKNKITSPSGLITTFTHSSSGLETSRKEAVGTDDEKDTTTTWDIDNRRILSVTTGNLKTSYAYTSHGLVSAITLTDLATNINRKTSYIYDDKDLLSSIDGPRTDVADVVNIKYDSNGNIKTLSNALNQLTTYEDYNASGQVGKITDTNGINTLLTYTARGWLKSTDRNGALTQYDYFPTGVLKKITLPNGQVAKYEYDEGERLIAIVDSLGNRVEYVRDVKGNITSTLIKDESGQLMYSQASVFNALGQLKRNIGSNGQLEAIRYDADGNVAETINALNESTYRSFDGLNRVKKIVAPDNGITSLTYNEASKLTSVTDPENKVTSYEYNAFGEMTRQSSPDSGEILYSYDSAGNLKTKQDGRGYIARYSYDALNRITSVTFDNRTNNIYYYYDDITSDNKGVGRLTRMTDQSGETQYRYNGFGQIEKEIRVIDGQSYITEYLYDNNGQLAGVNYPSGARLNYYFDSHARLNEVSLEVNGQVKLLANKMSYLPFGPVKGFTYGNGLSLEQTFDEDYRLTSNKVIGLKTLNYQYDTRNNITSIEDFNQAQNLVYDSMSRLTEGSGEYGVLDYSYNLVGDRTSKTDNGQVETYTYGATSSKSVIQGLVSEFKFDSSLEDSVTGSTASQLKYGAGYEDGISGQALSMSAANDYAILDVPEGIGENGEMTISFWLNLDSQRGKFLILGRSNYWNINDFAFFCFYGKCGVYSYYKGSTSRAEAKINYSGYLGSWHHWTGRLKNGKLDFFVDGQLVASRSNVRAMNDTYSFAVGATYSARYGITGAVDELQVYNRGLTDEEVIRISSLEESTPPAAIEPGDSNRLASIEGSNVLNFHYDASGNTTQKGDIQFVYNEAARLKKSVNGITTAEFLYNGKGERVVKLLGSTESHYIFNNHGQIIAEADGQGNIQKEYVYLAGQPFAQIIGSHIYYYHNSHLGTPEIMTDAAQNIVWQASYTPFGKATIEVNTIDNNIRFPGQYYDEESGLHYNYYRYYDPETGRYITSDPIGLGGGLNTYTYVGGNPINRVDPLGLIWWNQDAPDTVPVTGPTKTKLQCVETCLGAGDDWKGDGLLCTGGKEKSGHSKNSHHYSNNAVDIAGSRFNPYSNAAVTSCAAQCGFGAGQYEDLPGTKKDHWHFQNQPGNGLPALPSTIDLTD